MVTAVTLRPIANYAGFQLGWFLLVLTQSPWGIAWPLAFAAMHARWFARPGEFSRMGGVMVFGWCVDSIWQQTPWITYHGAGWPIPIWLSGLWLMFPLTLNHSLGWLQRSRGLQFVFGFIGGGGSYIAGAKLGAATLTGPAYILLPISWGIWLPLFYAWNRYSSKEPKPC